MFKVGQKIICIDASGNTHLTKGKEYTVSANHKCSGCGVEEVYLEGINNLCTLHCGHCGTDYLKSRVRFREERFKASELKPFENYSYETIQKSNSLDILKLPEVIAQKH